MSEELKPKPNEIWVTKEGNIVLTVYNTGMINNVGFIWYDSFDNTLTFTPMEHQLLRKSDLTVAEWGLMMHESVRKD